MFGSYCKLLVWSDGPSPMIMLRLFCENCGTISYRTRKRECGKCIARAMLKSGLRYLVTAVVLVVLQGCAVTQCQRAYAQLEQAYDGAFKAFGVASDRNAHALVECVKIKRKLERCQGGRPI